MLAQPGCIHASKSVPLCKLQRNGTVASMGQDSIDAFNAARSEGDRVICDALAAQIRAALPEAEGKIWHRHPVWFLGANPVVGYSRQKPGIRLMFWSGADFGEPDLNVIGKRFRDASVFFTDPAQIDAQALQRWLDKARLIQWNYRDIARNKGVLNHL